MIEVEDLRKTYGRFEALRGVSFRVDRGEVVGFLGPNGAGKSTTMRILTGFLQPSGGRASVLGHDVVRESRVVRARIGYLPESTPLYGELRVDEMIRFAAEMRGLSGKRLRDRLVEVVRDCGLTDVLSKTVRQLSKGYRQRVGLAQALVHEPDLLILDEPTSGLDPNQIVDVRDLIERVGEKHTVMLSTHTLQEVEASCSRVLMLDRGQLVADGSLAEVRAMARATKSFVRLRGTQAGIAAQIQSAGGTVLSTLTHVEDDEGSSTSVWRTTDSGPAELNAAAVRAGFEVLELGREGATLEAAFRELTGNVAAEASAVEEGSA